MRNGAALSAILIASILVVLTSLISLADRDGGSAGLPGLYPSSMNLLSDPGGDAGLVNMPQNLTIEVLTNNPDLISFFASSPFIGWSKNLIV